MKELLKTLLKKTNLYYPLQSYYRSRISLITNYFYRLTYYKFKGEGYTCNFCDSSYKKFVPEYPSSAIENAIRGNEIIAGFGENVFCPNCMSKNRERLVKIVLENYIKCRNKTILHFSPEKHVHSYLKDLATVITADLLPGFYKNIDPAITYADATNLQFPNCCFDVIIANHIMEHIPDDKKAMREMYRVLKDDGVALLQVPYSLMLPVTIEDPFINDRLKQEALFGQKDHVRVYASTDYINRLQDADFIVKVIQPEELKKFQKFAIQENENVVLAYKKVIR